MQDPGKKVDKLLEEALSSELWSRDFYKDAAQKASTRAGKKFFKKLAAFEQTHYDNIAAIIEARQSGNPPRLTPTAQNRDRDVVKRDNEKTFEPGDEEILEVITLAIRAEKEAQNRYLEIAQNLEDHEEKAIFNDLAEDENMHRRILEDQLYQMLNA